MGENQWGSMAIGAELSWEVTPANSTATATASAASKRRIFIASHGGTVYALSAKNGKLEYPQRLDVRRSLRLRPSSF
jgi:outer membrane protein assembly factor BamB